MNESRLQSTLAAVAAGETHDFAWLDGGPQTPGWIGVRADRCIESDTLDDLVALDAAWKADPSAIWIGWIDYDLGVDALLGRTARPGARAGFCARRYPSAQRIHAGGSVAAAQPPGRWPLGRLEALTPAQDYRAKVARAIEYIRAGDTYQINLSQAFEAQVDSSRTLSRCALDLYLRLREATPASMGALIQGGGAQWIVSNSPETLFDLRFVDPRDPRGAAEIASWPIKGTRPRHADPQADAAAGRELLASEKDAAEHIMIVDLVRNDLGRIAQTGSVRVVGAPYLTSLPTVHHLVSEVRATLPAGWSLQGVAASLFPGGSITGAPKRRTCEIIDALEGARRGIYCGAIFVLEPDGARFSIPIRTGELGAGSLRLRSGGGIVVDSDPEAERLETLAKARAFDPSGPVPGPQALG